MENFYAKQKFFPVFLRKQIRWINTVLPTLSGYSLSEYNPAICIFLGWFRTGLFFRKFDNFHFFPPNVKKWKFLKLTFRWLCNKLLHYVHRKFFKFGFLIGVEVQFWSKYRLGRIKGRTDSCSYISWISPIEKGILFWNQIFQS